MTTASATAITMPANWPCDKTASAPCSMVSLILSCFSSLREICSGTPVLLNGFEHVIVTQHSTRKPLESFVGLKLDLLFRVEKFRASSPAVRTVLVWNHEDGLHSLRRGTFTERHGVRRAHESAVQVLKVRKDNDCGNQAAHRCHRGDDTAPLLCPRRCHKFESEPASFRSRPEAACKQKCGSQHSFRPFQGPEPHADQAARGHGPQRSGRRLERSGNFPAPLLAGSARHLHQSEGYGFEQRNFL